MSQLTDLLRLSVGVLSGLLGILFGHAATRCTDPVATPSPPIVSQPDKEAHSVETCQTTEPADRQACLSETPSQANTLDNQIEQAADEMRQLDRLELPERADVAWRLHERLCNIGKQLDQSLRPDSNAPFVIPNSAPNALDGKTIWASRRNEAPDHRALVRSLLAAILVAPEKSAFMSKASRRKVLQQGAKNANHIVIVGDLGLIKKTDNAWFFLLSDPFNQSQQHTVRIDHQRLTQRITLGSRVAVLGTAVPHDASETPVVATEIYAIKQ